MGNVIKMNIFLLLRQKSTYILLAALVALIFSVTAVDVERTKQRNSQNDGSRHELKLYETGVTDFVEEDNIAGVLASTFSGNVVPMMLTVYCGLFVGTYQRFKLEKNIAGVAGEKYKLTISFLVIHAIYIAVLMLSLLMATALGKIFFQPEFTSWPTGNISGLLVFLGTYYILMLDICTVMTCFVDLVGNPITAIVIALLYGSTILYAVIDFIVKKVGIENFSAEDIFPLGIACKLTMYETMAHYVKAIGISLAFLVVALGVNIAIRKKRDVRC